MRTPGPPSELLTLAGPLYVLKKVPPLPLEPGEPASTIGNTGGRGGCDVDAICASLIGGSGGKPRRSEVPEFEADPDMGVDIAGDKFPNGGR